MNFILKYFTTSITSYYIFISFNIKLNFISNFIWKAVVYIKSNSRKLRVQPLVLILVACDKAYLETAVADFSLLALAIQIDMNTNQAKTTSFSKHSSLQKNGERYIALRYVSEPSQPSQLC